MNENTANSGNDFFYDLLDNPAHLSHSNAFNLQLLINDYPQSSLLRSMLAVKREEQSLRSASAYVDTKLLYKIATDVNSLRPVTDDQIILSESPNTAKAIRSITSMVEPPQLATDDSNYFHVPIDGDLAYFDDEAIDVVVDNEQSQREEVREVVAFVEETEGEELPPAVPNEQPQANEAADLHAVEIIEVQETENEPEVTVEDNVGNKNIEDVELIESDVVVEETALTDAEPETEASASEEKNAEPETTDEAAAALAREHDEYMLRSDQAPNVLNDIGEKPTHPHQEIDDDVFEEIVSIEDIGIEQLAVMNKVAGEHEEEQEKAAAEHVTEIENSYEVFEPTLPEDEELKGSSITGKKTGARMSRYNDEKMPYSFMWWLDKTRKEHAAVYQPFVEEQKNTAPVAAAFQKPQPPADHLQQQYMENILTVTTVVNELNHVPPKVDAPPPADSKVDKIIERFIQEEPQIKHPASAKLDNENKAKKSSEDLDELVTETLAKIYTEQMLYHKAILTYKKLMLKFPEKSLYFAGQIEQLEKRIN